MNVDATGESGSVAPWLVAVVAVGSLVAAGLVVAGSWLALVARAAAMAEAAALAAAAAAHPDAPPRPSPRAAAEAVVVTAGARVLSCECRRGDLHVAVRVAIAVDAGVAPTWLVGDTVVATATARSWSTRSPDAARPRLQRSPRRADGNREPVRTERVRVRAAPARRNRAPSGSLR